jgi:hypothetical protein
MKIIILASTVILLFFASCNQKDSANNMENNDMMNSDEMGSDMNPQEMDKTYGDGAMMMNGKMMMHHSGNMTIMEQDTTMLNGTRVMANGTCINTDGTKFMMQEGQHMDMSGNLMPMIESDIKY